jgi:alpha-L-rhamnosidase
MLPGDAPGQEEFISKETPPELLWTGYYFNNTWILAQAARILGKAEEAAAYAERAEAIRTALNEKWLDPAGTHYATNSQTSNIAALAFGVVPEGNRVAVAQSLIANITEQRKGHLHTGNLGTACIMDALAEHGGDATLHRIATSTDYPGWGYMVSQGATTIWEAWGGVEEGFVGYNSGEDSMPMFATISEYFYSDIAGLRGPDYFGTRAVAPGFREITIRPRLQEGLQHASATIRTVRGLASAAWQRNENSFDLSATIPPNATAVISLPKSGMNVTTIEESEQTVWENQGFVKGGPGISAATEEDEYVTFAVGSGSYRFTLNSEP